MTPKATQPKLLDCAAIAREYGVSRDTASKWMRKLPQIVNPGGVRKVMVWRKDLERMLLDHQQEADHAA